MQFIIIISGPVSLPTIYYSQRCTTDDLLSELFPTPSNDARKGKEETRASREESVGEDRTKT
jgi:hypothetical protein